ncbi:MAG: succinate dehydrogenase, cytochrome b556 subunit [Alphaproteobacteria bacterium]|nr:succinate dehydrogenase, cytochrome b556 subunit [Alphaproteobacteria bacterium]
MAPVNRPLSPHLQIYRPQITSTLSILHRLTGVALAAGAVLLAYWLAAAAYGPGAFERANDLLASPVGRLVLFGMTFSFFYHFANGVRHLAWDIGLGLQMKTLRLTGILVVLVSLALTGATWIAAYAAAGKL